ncbi:hypothetical protein BDGGKGIB_01273 [Nodularia sphaerocarpa UHCC 0038]|nr:hypothetical protein BDGGKGIB_01273 [Nodularia sphaerocarpa UHCC 0038]
MRFAQSAVGMENITPEMGVGFLIPVTKPSPKMHLCPLSLSLSHELVMRICFKILRLYQKHLSKPLPEGSALKPPLPTR